MKINVHTHVFNFQSILTKETILLLKHRLTGKNLPPEVRNMLLRYLRHKRGKNAGPISIEDFHKYIREKELIDRLVPSGMRRIFDEFIDLPESADNRSLFLRTLRDAVSSRFRQRNTDVYNAMEWLRIGLMKKIDEVTDDLMSHLDEDDVSVLLPMDIINKNALKREQKLFNKQLDDTITQALRYPGRALPFGMVNPAREDAYTLFKDAAEKGAVTGLKLYPALGYPVWEGQVKKALELCNEIKLPVLLHCNDTGFRKSAEDAQFGHPDHWIPVLDKLPDLKVCFGHFGGEVENDEPVWTADSVPADSWADRILYLMGEYPERVFADLSYHADHFESEEAESNYRQNIKQQLAKPEIRTQILWGTDYHLLRIDATDTDYTDGFRDWVDEEDFTQIAYHNGRRFLGLPDEQHEASEGINRHISWLHQNRARSVHGKAAGWLRYHPEGKQIEGGPGADAASWDRNNTVHVAVFRAIWYADPSHLSEGSKTYIEDKTYDMEAVFEQIGRLPMRDMVFHRDVLGSSADRDERISSFINTLKVWLNRSSNLERVNPDSSGFRKKVRNVCVDPEKTVPDLAEAVAMFYRSKEGLE